MIKEAVKWEIRKGRGRIPSRGQAESQHQLGGEKRERGKMTGGGGAESKGTTSSTCPGEGKTKKKYGILGAT